MNEEKYQVIVDGNFWYQGNHTYQSSKKYSTKSIVLASCLEKCLDWVDFYGEISELNIWSGTKTKGIYNRLLLIKFQLLDIDLGIYDLFLPSEVKFYKSLSCFILMEIQFY